MNRILDAADAAYWWLKTHVAAAAAIAVAIVALLVVGFLATGGDDAPAVPAGAVALVGDTPIEQAELTRWEGIYTKAVAGQSQPTEAETRKQAFELLAGSAWITAEAERQDVEVTPAQVTKAIDDYFSQSGASTPDKRNQLLAQLGVDEADLRFQQRISLLSGALREKAVKAVQAPSADAIKAAYERDPQRWATPSKRDLRLVLAPDEAKAKQARAALEGGQSFAKVVEQFASDAALVSAKGVVKDLQPGTSDATFERAVFGAPQGALQGPVKTAGGWLVFQVQKVTPLPAQGLEQATKAIRANLLATAQNAATERFLKDLRARWKARTTCTALVAGTDFCRKD